MEEKTFRNVIFQLIFFLMAFKIFTTKMARAQRIPISIKVGAVLDMNDYFGRIGLNCMSMAPSEFYAASDHYKARLVHINKDSKDDVVGAAAAVQASFMIALANKAQVPVITLLITSHSLASLHSSYFIRETLDDSSQAHVKSAIIQGCGCGEVLPMPIYVDNEYGEWIMPFLTDVLEHVKARAPYRIVISPLATDDLFTAELYKFMTIQRVFLIHVLTSLGSCLVILSKQLRMVSVDYVWTLSNGISYESYSTDPFFIVSMQGIRNPRFQEARITKNSTGLEAVVVSRAGQDLIQDLSTTTFRGLVGKFHLVDGQIQSPPYEIINLDGPEARVVGYRPKENGFVKDLNSAGETIKAYSTSKPDFESAIWSGDNISPAKGWWIQTNWKKLITVITVKTGFKNSTVVIKGFSIDSFEKMMKKALAYDVPHEYTPFATSDHKMAGNYNDLTPRVYIEHYDEVVGDVTIVAKRSEYVDFTMSYVEPNIIMVVAYKGDESENVFFIVSPLSLEMWVTLIGLSTGASAVMYVISFLIIRAHRKVVQQTVTPATIWNNTIRRFWIFEDGELGSPTLKNRGMTDRDQQSPISLQASQGNDGIIFRSPSEHNENIQNEQGTPGDARKCPQEEPSHMEMEIEIEIEIA